MGLALVLVVGLDAAGSSVITHGPRSRPWVALTFDDGWSASRCESIARTLRARRAPATFFINGYLIAREPARWRTMLDGFAVANHTRTHAWLTRLSSTEIRRQIASNEAIHERILRRPMLKLMRPPYGAYDSRVVSIADSLGYRTILWNVSGGDTTSGATTRSVIRNATRGGNGAVVLLHCGPSVTPGAVGPIIDSYRARGYQLVDLGQMLGLSPPPSPTACRVRNLETGRVSGSLQAAVDAARSGHRLRVRGTCKGTTTLRKELRIQGRQTEASGRPTLDGDDRGAVVTVAEGVSVWLRDLVVRGGEAPRGGGIRDAGRLVLRDVTVRANRATIGGGIHVWPGAAVYMRGATMVRGNEATQHGGGVSLRGSASMTDQSVIRDNSAGQDGGGVWSYEGSLIVKGDATIARNGAGRHGGGILNRGASLLLEEQGLVQGNSAAVQGGGVYDDAGSVAGLVCGDGGNVVGNTPDDCFPAP